MIRLRIAAALATLYVAWGSTYLAMREAVVGLPPFTAAGLRFGTAGLVLLAVARATGQPWPRPPQLAAAARAGLLMVPAGSALVMFAVQEVASGVAALVLATIPAQLVLWAWVLGGSRPRPRVLGGLGIGLLGVALLAASRLGPGGSALHLGAVVLAPVGWSLGSLALREPRQAASTPMALGTAFVAGGLGALVAGLALREPALDAVVAASWQTWAAMLYLVVVGSLIGGACYAWLLRVAPVRLVATYAYVNPLVALTLGGLLGGEVVTARTALAAGVLLLGVALVVGPLTLGRGRTEPGDVRAAA